ncbi:trigger factor [Actinobacillus pleuropneumoniae]|nr:trigger factor [Actinobacillus pleuropneumoniae]
MYYVVKRFNVSVVKPEMAAQLPAELFEADAKRRVQVGLLLSTVIGTNELKVDENVLKKRLQKSLQLTNNRRKLLLIMRKTSLTENIRNVV